MNKNRIYHLWQLLWITLFLEIHYSNHLLIKTLGNLMTAQHLENISVSNLQSRNI